MAFGGLRSAVQARAGPHLAGVIGEVDLVADAGDVLLRGLHLRLVWGLLPGPCPEGHSMCCRCHPHPHPHPCPNPNAGPKPCARNERKITPVAITGVVPAPRTSQGLPLARTWPEVAMLQLCPKAWATHGKGQARGSRGGAGG